MSMDLATLGIRVDSTQIKTADRDLDNLAKTGKKAEQSGKDLQQSFNGLKGVLAAIGLGAVINEAAKMADTWKNVEGRLRLVTSGTSELANVTDKLFGIAQRTRQGFEATGDLYANLARTTKSLGANQQQLLQVTETISQSLIVSGANASSSEAALRQLRQAFASGALRGDELNSIMENTPRIATAIAEGMGVTIGQLRSLGKEGKLTATEIFTALLSQKETLEKEFAQMPVTISQSFTVLRNEMLKFVGESDKVSGASSAVAGAIQFVSRNLDGLANALAIIGVAMGLRFVASMVAATASTIAFQAGLVGLTTKAEIAGFAIGTLLRSLMGLVAIGAISALIVGFATEVATTKGAVDQANRSYKEMQDRLKVAGDTATTAGGQTAGLGKDALGSIPKIDAFAGRVGNAAQQLYNMARAAKVARLEMLQTELAKSQSNERALAARTDAGRSDPSQFVKGDLLNNVEVITRAAVGDLKSWASGGRSDREVNDAYGKQTKVSIDLQRRIAEERGKPIASTDAPSFNAMPTASGKPDKKTSGGGGKTDAERAADEAKRKYADSLQHSAEFAASLKEETALIGKNAIETKLAGVYKEALAAKTKPLADAIMAEGQAWLVATEAQANTKFKQDYADQVNQMAYENSLIGKSAVEIEKANLQRAITLRIRDADRDGITLDIANIQAETKALMDNIDVKHQGNAALEGAKATADTMRDAAGAVRELTEGFGEMFGTAGEGFSNLINTIFEYGEAQAAIVERQVELDGQTRDGVTTNIADQAEYDRLSQQSSRNRIASYGNMIGAAKTFFKEGSTGYKLLEGAERAYRLFQFAMQVKSIIMDTLQTGTSVANSGTRAAASGVEAVAKAMASLPPPLNFIAAGAVIAFLVAMGVKMVGGKGKGGSGSSTASSSAKAATETYKGPVDQYGAPTSSYSVLKPGGTTVANDNVTPYGASNSGGGFRGGDITIQIQGGADMRTITEQVVPLLDQYRDATVQDARVAVAADQAAQSGRQRIGGG